MLSDWSKSRKDFPVMPFLGIIKLIKILPDIDIKKILSSLQILVS